MEDEKIREYAVRISQANASELVAILYELFMYSIDEALAAFDTGDGAKAAKYMKKAQECVCELLRSLDLRYELSRNLEALYRYVHEQIISSIIKEKPVNLDEVKKIMGSLQEAFIEVAKQDSSGPVMQNAQQVYAGLTYGKGRLNEVLLSGNEASRGFKV